MAVPKKKTSKSRRNKRRTHQGLSIPALVKCSNCGAMIRPHNACHKCGYYQGEKVDHTVELEQERH